MVNLVGGTLGSWVKVGRSDTIHEGLVARRLSMSWPHGGTLTPPTSRQDSCPLGLAGVQLSFCFPDGL